MRKARLSEVERHDDCRNALTARRVLHFLIRVVLDRNVSAVSAQSRLGAIRVSLRSTLLTPRRFSRGNRVRLGSLTNPKAAQPRRGILNNLLASNANAVRLATANVVLNDALSNVRIRTVVLRRSNVLTHRRHRERIEKCLVREGPIVVRNGAFAVDRLLGATSGRWQDGVCQGGAMNCCDGGNNARGRRRRPSCSVSSLF